MEGKTIQVTLQHKNEKILASIDRQFDPKQVGRLLKLDPQSTIKAIHKGKVLKPGDEIRSKAKILVLCSSGPPSILPWPFSSIEQLLPAVVVDHLFVIFDWIASILHRLKPDIMKYKQGDCFTLSEGEETTLVVRFNGKFEEDTITCTWSVQDCGTLVNTQPQTFKGIGDPHECSVKFVSNGNAGSVNCTFESTQETVKQVFWFNEAN
eukprot:gene6378-9299_t